MPLCTRKIADSRGRKARTRPRGSGRVATDVVARAVPASPRTVRRYTEIVESKAKAQGERVYREWPVSIDGPRAEGVADGARAGSAGRSRTGLYPRPSA
jgi:hypothetical protein